MGVSDSVILSKICRRFENKPLQMNWSDNVLNQQIYKMVKDNSHKLTYYEHMMMECCLLFICGFSYSQISERLGIAVVTVSNMLNDEKYQKISRRRNRRWMG